eukprot:TRINITY_DN15314_c0_g2_i1.p1 TRINITY_DN15314_c0_g2~~TRINITY_DN15314_c0_g2_i1.p1  ORF type:complete len:390 (+),score=128.30 TRINITY_DN15314_c0_g2_i1:283-1452(+)
MVLGYLLQVQDLNQFIALIRRWRNPPDHQGPLFSPSSLITAVQLQLETWQLSDVAANQSVLKINLAREALAELFLCARQYVQALDLLLQLGQQEVWQLITEHGLFGSIQDKVLMLMRFDAGKATDLLVQHTEDVPVSLVVQQLQPEPAMLHEYLHQLFLFDESKGTAFHDLQVSLYAQFDRPSLAHLLDSSNSYKLETALQTCEEQGLYPEQVRILEKMGKWKQALGLLMNGQMNDIDAAIALVQRQDERSVDGGEVCMDLWKELFELCSKSSESIGRVLDHLSDSSLSADPIEMIKSIPKGAVIPNATTKLHQIVMAHKQNGSLQERFVRLLESDAGKLSHAHHNSHKRAVRVFRRAPCGSVSYTHLRAHETPEHLVCRLLLEKKKNN